MERQYITQFSPQYNMSSPYDSRAKGDQTSEIEIEDTIQEHLNFRGTGHISKSEVNIMKIKNILASKVGDKVGFLVFCRGQTTKSGSSPFHSLT